MFSKVSKSQHNRDTRYQEAMSFGHGGKNSSPQPGRGRFVPRPAFPALHGAVSKWKALNTPRKIERDPLNIPSGI